MLSEAKLPKHFWDEALYTAVHVIKLSLAVALNGEVPDKIWFGKNVRYDICESSIVKHVCMFQRMRDPSWIRRQGSASLLVMVKMNLAISSLILLRESQLEVVM